MSIHMSLNIRYVRRGILARAVAGTGDARGAERASVRRVLALVGGRAQPHVLLVRRAARIIKHPRPIVAGGALPRVRAHEDSADVDHRHQ